MAWDVCLGCNGPKGYHNLCPACHRRWQNDMRAREAARPGCAPPATDGYGLTLHVGFLCLEETAEMLGRLAEFGDRKQAKPAASKVFTSPLVPRPIDGTAARVSGLPK